MTSPLQEGSAPRKDARRCICQSAASRVVDGLRVCESCGDLRTDLTTDAEKRAYLTARGWGTWYHVNAWVHPKTIQDPAQQDYTNYSMPVDAAFACDRDDKPPMPPMGLMLQRGFELLRALDQRSRSPLPENPNPPQSND